MTMRRRQQKKKRLCHAAGFAFENIKTRMYVRRRDLCVPALVLAAKTVIYYVQQVFHDIIYAFHASRVYCEEWFIRSIVHHNVPICYTATFYGYHYWYLGRKQKPIDFREELRRLVGMGWAEINSDRQINVLRFCHGGEFRVRNDDGYFGYVDNANN